MLKKLLLSTLLFATSLIANPETKFVRNLDQLIAMSQSGKSSLPWPGFKLSHPIVISFDNGHLYAFHLKSPNKAWQKIGSSLWFLPNDPWGISKIPFSPFHPLGDEKVMLFHVSENQATALFAVVHENFHLHQFEKFPSPGLSEYRDHMDPTNLALMEIEDSLLADFLKGRGDLRDFVALNQIRHLLIDPSSVVWEQHQQLMEGLADYATYRLFEAGGMKWPETPLTALTKPIPNLSDYAIKGRHYGVGTTLAMALDTLKIPQWREDVEKSGKSPGEYLSEALMLSPSEIIERFEIARIKHNLLKLQNEIAAEVNLYMSEVQTHLDNHAKAPGKIVRIGTLQNQGSAGGGINEKSYYLPQGGTLALRDTSTAVSNDQSWNLKLNDVSHVILKEGGIREFKLSNEAQIRIDGEKMRLDTLVSHPMVKSFTSLSWSCKQGEFFSTGNEGVIEVDDEGIVTILF